MQADGSDAAGDIASWPKHNFALLKSQVHSAFQRGELSLAGLDIAKRSSENMRINFERGIDTGGASSLDDFHDFLSELEAMRPSIARQLNVSATNAAYFSSSL